MNNNSDGFIIEYIYEQQQDVLQAFSATKHILSTESSVGIDNKKNKNDNIKLHFSDQTSKPIIIVLNISFTILLEDTADPNQHISFMIMIKIWKFLLLLNSIIIPLKTISSSYSLEYLKNLWYIDFNSPMHICIS